MGWMRAFISEVWLTKPGTKNPLVLSLSKDRFFFGPRELTQEARTVLRQAQDER